VTQLPHSSPRREAIKFALLGRILLETEAPTARQGKTWEPADLIATATALIRLNGVGLQRLKEVTNLNGDSSGFKW
jgi:Tat protein secretion system quality control protein TatD with DNase activity